MSALSKLVRTYWKPRSTRNVDLLSTRYAADSDWPAKISAETQAAYFQTLADGLRSKELLLVAQKCPCGQTTHDTLISQRDRYGLHFNSVVCDACGTVRLDPYFDEKSSPPSIQKSIRAFMRELRNQRSTLIANLSMARRSNSLHSPIS